MAWILCGSSSLYLSPVHTELGFQLLVGDQLQCASLGCFLSWKYEIRKACTLIFDLNKSARSARNFHILNEVLLLSVSANPSSRLESQQQQVIELASSNDLNLLFEDVNIYALQRCEYFSSLEI
jgi:hypothetical protein